MLVTPDTRDSAARSAEPRKELRLPAAAALPCAGGHADLQSRQVQRAAHSACCRSTVGLLLRMCQQVCQQQVKGTSSRAPCFRTHVHCWREQGSAVQHQSAIARPGALPKAFLRHGRIIADHRDAQAKRTQTHDMHRHRDQKAAAGLAHTR